MNRHLLLGSLVLVVAAAGCGGSSKSGIPTIGAARTYALTDFQPSAPVAPGKPTRVSFKITEPNGTTLTKFKRGPGPHTGVHLIIVRKDLATIIHRHPPIAPDGTISETVIFTKPGPYRVVVDVYPQDGAAAQFPARGIVARRRGLPPAEAARLHVDRRGRRLPDHDPRAADAACDPGRDAERDGHRPGRQAAEFTPWYGALAHAIFFREGTLDYFHTHVCAPGASGCTSLLGATKVAGSSSTPGKLTVGVLVPVAGTWRLFLQTKVNGHILTAPFTLVVKP